MNDQQRVAMHEALAQPHDKGESNDVSAMADVEQSRMGSGAKDGEVMQQQGEPVYYQWRRKHQPWSIRHVYHNKVEATTDDSEVRELYTTPPVVQQGEWVDLTNDEINEIVREAARGSATRRDGSTSQRIARAIIAKFKAKNTPPVVPQGEPVAFLAEATRFKVCMTDHECTITGLPRELGGRWVALVAAEDDCHLRYTNPPVVPQGEPVATIQLPDPYDDRDGVWFDAEGLKRLRELPPGTKLYPRAPSVEAAIEATKEKAANVLSALYEKLREDREPMDHYHDGKMVGVDLAEQAIRRMK